MRPGADTLETGEGDMKMKRMLLVLVPLLFALPAAAASVGKALPNPVRLDATTTSTTITVLAPSDGAAFRAEFSIVDMTGREVIRKSRSEYLTSAFTHAWDGRNSAGRLVKSGVYIVYVWRRYQDVSRGEDSERFRLGVVRDGV